MTTDRHEEIVTQYVHGFTLECSCGWEGGQDLTLDSLHNQFVDHRRGTNDMADTQTKHYVKVIRWGWKRPWFRFTRSMKWVPGCRSLVIGPYEFIWRYRDA
jgi:hypothetical protein